MLLNVSMSCNSGGASHANARASEIMGLMHGEIFEHKMSDLVSRAGEIIRFDRRV